MDRNSNDNSETPSDVLIPSTMDDTVTKKRTTTKGNAQKHPAIPGKRRVRKKKRGQSDTHTIIKYAALFLLVAQMVGLVLLMRYSRTVPRSEDAPLYLASTAVFVMEVMKLVICVLVVVFQTGADVLSELYFHTIGSPKEILKLCVPSLLYTVQNNLLYLALSNLDAATYQVCYQLKILTTAVFSAILLQKKFSPKKWTSLIILTVGVAIVQLSGSGDQHHHHQTDHHDSDLERAAQTLTQNRFVGLVAVLCAACTSGFSGVYFGTFETAARNFLQRIFLTNFSISSSIISTAISEKILKGSLYVNEFDEFGMRPIFSHTWFVRTSLWIRNIQMGLPSVFIAYITVFFKDKAAVQKQGFLGGYTAIVWTVVTVQAVGGLIVATVVKYADNVLKVFATSFSIVVSCVISAFLFDFHPTVTFLIGASLVVTATVMYSSPERRPRRKSILPTSRK